MSYEVFKSELENYQKEYYPDSAGKYFGKATQTKLENLSYKYAIGLSVVTEHYLIAMFEVLKDKVDKEQDHYYIEAMKKMVADDYRQVWYKINNKLQSEIATSKEQRASEWAKWRNAARKIIKSDETRMQRVIDKIHAEIDSGQHGPAKVHALETLVTRYTAYLKKAKNPEAIGHFSQRLRDYPHITTFLVKPK